MYTEQPVRAALCKYNADAASASGLSSQFLQEPLGIQITLEVGSQRRMEAEQTSVFIR